MSCHWGCSIVSAPPRVARPRAARYVKLGVSSAVDVARAVERGTEPGGA